MQGIDDHTQRRLDRARAYRSCFMADGQFTKDGEDVYKDLAQFCHFFRTTAKQSPAGNMDPIASAMAEGRREVFLRILAQLGLSETAIIEQIRRDQAND